MKLSRILSAVLAILCILPCFFGCQNGSRTPQDNTEDPEISVTAPSTEPVTEPITEPETAPITDPNPYEGSGSLQVSYTFDNEKRGSASGTITIVGDDLGTLGYYLLCLTDANGLMENCEPFATVKANRKTLNIAICDGTYLPAEATGFVVLESDADSLLSPDLSHLVGAYTFPVEKRLGLSEVRMTFASVSDVHINYDGDDNDASGKWTKALNFFAEMGMEYVMVSGDMTGSATSDEYRRYVKAIEASNFDINRIYEERGNHDSQDISRFLKYTASTGNEEIRPFENSPYYYVLFQNERGSDNLFIFMAQELTNISNTHLENNFSDAQLDWLEDLLRTYSRTDTNIFILEHALIHNFGPGDRYDGVYVQPMIFSDDFPRNLRFKQIISEYKEAILMSGHTHLSFREGVNYSDENGTTLRMIHNSSTSQPRSYTASGSISYDSEGLVTRSYGSEGYLVYVYDHYVLYIAYNISDRKIIPSACFMIDLYRENRDEIVSITLTEAPQKTAYIVGEFFDPAGLVITGTTRDGQQKIVRGWKVLKTSSLSARDHYVEIGYGDLSETVRIEITVEGGDEALFEGRGTKNDPFLISTPADFQNLTQLFNIAEEEDSPYGEDKYYLQTADIDMTGYEGYSGTYACGDSKRYFGGIYNGNGYSVTVAIDADGERSVFPYVTGTLCNLTIRGSIKAVASVQPIRTIASSATVANCIFDLTLSANRIHGLCYSDYGTSHNLYIHASFQNGTKVTAVTETVRGTTSIENIFHDITGADVDEKYSTAASPDAACEAINASDFTVRSITLLPMTVQNGVLVFAR